MDLASSSSYISTIERRTERYTFSANSNYIKRTSLGMNATHSRQHNNISGSTQSNRFSAFASHTRNVFKGALNGSVRYSTHTLDNEGNESEADSLLYRASYRRALFKRVDWSMSASRLETWNDGSRSINSSLNNTFRTWLRAWIFTARHTYLLQETPWSDRKESRILLTATRKFFFTY
jgi:hypothetical protein